MIRSAGLQASTCRTEVRRYFLCLAVVRLIAGRQAWSGGWRK